MGKITVKHFLNKELKSFAVRNEKYYSVYLMITVNRKTTKVKSYEFEEYQTEKDFDSFLQPENENFEAMQIEAKTVENLIEAQMEIAKQFDNTFDSLLFSAFYNLSHEILLIDSFDLEVLMGDYVEDYSHFWRFEPPNKGITVFEWFSPENQDFAEKYIREKGKYPVQKGIIKHVNVAILYAFMTRIDFDSQKYRKIYDKYELIHNGEYVPMTEAHSRLKDAFGY